PADRLLARAAEAIDTAARVMAARAASVPVLEYPPELPVSGARERIAAALAAHQVIIVCGDTGSGKTTQLPKICLAAGRGVRGMIGHTQPRRIAARAVAARLAEETATSLGAQVGYKVRFTDETADATLVKLMTDGILLAEIRHDPQLLAYDTLIIDEAHERSLNIDFLLGYLKTLLPQRPELRVIITSATIDPQRFSRHFDDAPILEVAGRSYPVEVEYDPPAEDTELVEHVVATACRLAARPLEDLGGGGHRDMLVFLPGERLIRDTERALRRDGPRGFQILPLYGRLPGGRQDLVFHPTQAPRIVLATNVAETSLTVPRIRYVIDSGTARISRYSPRSKIQRLPVEPISQASAHQRKGRCGRLAPGLCVRLYSAEDFAARPPQPDSEILRTNLAAVILQMSSLGLGAPEAFPFLEPPPLATVRDGYQVLEELGALDGDARISDLGRSMARLPVDPRLARMLLEAGRLGSLREVLVIVAALAIQDPRERPPEHTEQADACHGALADPRSDFLFYLNLWQTLRAQEKAAGQKGARRWCRENFISWRRAREWQELHLQLAEHCRALQLRVAREAADYAAIHRALLAGLVSLVARRDQGRHYLGARGSRLQLFPGSALRTRPPGWIMAAELIETSRVYAATVARVTPAWIEAAAGPLVRRRHEGAFFDAGSGRVLCHEQASLWGLTLAAGRRVPLAPHDPEAARALFIQDALAGRQLRRAPRVIEANWRHLHRLEALETRSRRRDLVLGDAAHAALYDERLPASVSDARSLARWLAREPDAEQRLRLEITELALRDPAGIDPGAFPDVLEIDGNQLALEYRFEPGAEDDGITLAVPILLLPALDPARLSWLVPGYRALRIAALLRRLPKAWRRAVVPVPDTAAALARVAPGFDASGTSLEAWLAGELETRHGFRPDPHRWPEGLEAEASMRVRVLDAAGETLGVGRDLAALQARFAPARAERRQPLAAFERDGVRQWDFGELPERQRVRQGPLSVTLYPALLDRGNSISLRLLETAGAAEQASRGGFLRLAMLRFPAQRRNIEQQLRRNRRVLLHWRAIGTLAELLEEVTAATFADVMLPEAGRLPRDRAQFEARATDAAPRLMPASEAVSDTLSEILELHSRLQAQLSQATLPTLAGAQIRQQAARLVHPRMLRETPRRWRERLPVYLRAASIRADKLLHGHPRDADYAAELERHRERLAQWRTRATRPAEHAVRVEEYAWLIEELAVSLYAQQLGTVIKVSARRLDEHWLRLTGSAAAVS
ncbi:MAG: ATP-dependent RNA helicase HrpA, partial [Gammaproteobacteria bacterium]|nr:ATP-dependent RNA helicase HrpA [Gammaproteobacteria bacterium]